MISVQNLKTLIEDIARGHVREIGSKNSSTIETSWDHGVDEIASKIISLSLFESLEEKLILNVIDKLKESLATAVNPEILVKNHGIGKFVPVSYEVLTLIFAQSNEKFRQKHLEELIEFYFNQFPEGVLNRFEFEKLVASLLQVVKLEILLQLVEDGGDADEVKELVNNLINMFKSPKLNQEDIYAIVKSKLESNDFQLISYELVPLKQKNGHLGEYYTLKILVKRSDGNEESINLFAKFMRLLPSMKMMFSEGGPSMKEDFFYRLFLPTLHELGLKDLSDFAPKCYFSRVNDVIVLEDMILKGYTGLTPNIKLEFSALKCGVHQLAKLHACTIVAEEILGKSLHDLYGEYLKEEIFKSNRDKEITEMFDNMKNTIYYLFDHFPEQRSKYSDEQLREIVEKGWEQVFLKVKTSDKFRNVICHGDVYVSNLLFKFKNDDQKECQEAKIIDFQILRYCPPTQDLMFFLYQNSLKSTLDEHLEVLLNEYYEALSGYLQRHQLDVDKVYTRKEFDESVNYMRSEGIFHALFYSPLQSIDPAEREAIFSDNSNLKKLREDKYYFIDVGLQNEQYRLIMRGLLENMIAIYESGYF